MSTIDLQELSKPLDDVWLKHSKIEVDRELFWISTYDFHQN